MYTLKPTAANVWTELSPSDPNLSAVQVECAGKGNYVAIWWDYLKEKLAKSVSSSSSSVAGNKKKKK